jgi:HlyB family type I secretion system ABC transporter
LAASDQKKATGAGASPRVRGLAALAAKLGVELDRQFLKVLDEVAEPDAAALLRCAQDGGLSGRALKPNWRELVTLGRGGAPVMLLLNGGGAALIERATDDGAQLLLRDPAGADQGDLTSVDRLRLEEFWTGTAIVLRTRRGAAHEDRRFDLGWLLGDVLLERRLFRDIGLATIVLGALTLAPPLVFMAIANRVVLYESWSTLLLLALGLALVTLHETLLGFAQRHLTAVAAARIDARINLFVLGRLLRLPLDFFEKSPAGEITHRAWQVNRIRDFLTGQLFKTFLELSTLVIVLPVLFYLNASLTWVVVGCSVVIALIILAYLPKLRRLTGEVTAAETARATIMVETIHGMRTVKALALEARQAEDWNDRVARVTRARLALAHTANWPQTLALPFERFMSLGVLILGTYQALTSSGEATIGSLFAFYMLSGRVAGPLVALAGLINSYEEVRAAIGEASSVLNHESERPAGAAGVRPHFEGRLSFEDVTFKYPGALQPTLEKVSFEVPPGTLLGVVGRSGSGKSTVTRLLQGLNTGYSGLVKIDGVELREIDLQHLRRNFGVVLQDNFLFRGTIRENIAAGRPGITFQKIIQAARLAGAEEFIERLPRGYDTFIEEGSPNLSGGQRQRLAIARAVITDPAIMIFDEATSALDPESEAIVNANLLRIAQGRTVVVVSHRLSSLVDSDLILVLDRGSVVDLAPHATLLGRCAIYRQLWLQQNRGTNPVRELHVASR